MVGLRLEGDNCLVPRHAGVSHGVAGDVVEVLEDASQHVVVERRDVGRPGFVRPGLDEHGDLPLQRLALHGGMLPQVRPPLDLRQHRSQWRLLLDIIAPGTLMCHPGIEYKIVWVWQTRAEAVVWTIV